MKFILCDGELVSASSSTASAFLGVGVSLESDADFFCICDHNLYAGSAVFGSAPDIVVGWIVSGMPTFSLELEGKSPTYESKMATIHAVAVYLQQRYDDGKSTYEPNDIATLLIEHLQPKVIP